MLFETYQIYQTVKKKILQNILRKYFQTGTCSYVQPQKPLIVVRQTVIMQVCCAIIMPNLQYEIYSRVRNKRTPTLINFPGPTFIQGSTFIPDSRVEDLIFQIGHLTQLRHKNSNTSRCKPSQFNSHVLQYTYIHICPKTTL